MLASPAEVKPKDRIDGLVKDKNYSMLMEAFDDALVTVVDCKEAACALADNNKAVEALFDAAIAAACTELYIYSKLGVKSYEDAESISAFYSEHGYTIWDAKKKNRSEKETKEAAELLSRLGE
jgi:hypothetical protein